MLFSIVFLRLYFIYKTAFLTVYVCPRWYVPRNSYGTLKRVSDSSLFSFQFS
nr:MAG TPA: hypothetical protein [Caudoviricetes sp.]